MRYGNTEKKEKIKINISQSMMQILQNDMRLFGFIKNNNTLNENDFINTLIVNYYDTYKSTRNSFFKEISTILGQFKIEIKGYEADEIINKIIEKTQKNSSTTLSKNLNVHLSIKPTHISQYTLNSIYKNINNYSQSGYFRDLLSSYIQLPQYKREQIIFKEIYEEINEVIENENMMDFSNADNGTNHSSFLPYEIVTNKEEMFNYLIGEKDGKPFSIKMAKIRNIQECSTTQKISEKVAIYLELMKKHGPQFTYPLDCKLPIIVKLTKEGQKQYDNSYFFKPQYEKKENDLYYFDCSPDQAALYFKRFGPEAIILSPSNLKKSLKKHYKRAYEAYSRDEDISNNPNAEAVNQ